MSEYWDTIADLTVGIDYRAKMRPRTPPPLDLNLKACPECGQMCKGSIGLATHIRRSHPREDA